MSYQRDTYSMNRNKEVYIYVQGSLTDMNVKNIFFKSLASKFFKR